MGIELSVERVELLLARCGEGRGDGEVLSAAAELHGVGNRRGVEMLAEDRFYRGLKGFVVQPHHLKREGAGECEGGGSRFHNRVNDELSRSWTARTLW